MFSLSDSIQISSFNTPLDVRTRVADLSKLTDGSIQMPYVGLIVWVTNEEKAYVVTGITGTLITSYEVLNSEDYFNYTSSTTYTDLSNNTKPVRKDGYVVEVDHDTSTSPYKYILQYIDGLGIHHKITVSQNGGANTDIPNTIAEVYVYNGNYQGLYQAVQEGKVIIWNNNVATVEYLNNAFRLSVIDGDGALHTLIISAGNLQLPTEDTKHFLKKEDYFYFDNSTTFLLLKNRGQIPVKIDEHVAKVTDLGTSIKMEYLDGPMLTTVVKSSDESISRSQVNILLSVEVDPSDNSFDIKNALGTSVGSINFGSNSTTGIAELTFTDGTNTFSAPLPSIRYDSNTQLLKYTTDGGESWQDIIKMSNLQIKEVAANTSALQLTPTLGDLVLIGDDTNGYELNVFDGTNWQSLGSINNVSLVADQVEFDNSTNGFNANKVQGAIEEVNEKLYPHYKSSNVDYAIYLPLPITIKKGRKYRVKINYDGTYQTSGGNDAPVSIISLNATRDTDAEQITIISSSTTDRSFDTIITNNTSTDKNYLRTTFASSYVNDSTNDKVTVEIIDITETEGKRAFDTLNGNVGEANLSEPIKKAIGGLGKVFIGKGTSTTTNYELYDAHFKEFYCPLVKANNYSYFVKVRNNKVVFRIAIFDGATLSDQQTFETSISTFDNGKVITIVSSGDYPSINVSNGDVVAYIVIDSVSEVLVDDDKSGGQLSDDIFSIENWIKISQNVNGVVPASSIDYTRLDNNLKTKIDSIVAIGGGVVFSGPGKSGDNYANYQASYGEFYSLVEKVSGYTYNTKIKSHKCYFRVRNSSNIDVLVGEGLITNSLGSIVEICATNNYPTFNVSNGDVIAYVVFKSNDAYDSDDSTVGALLTDDIFDETKWETIYNYLGGGGSEIPDNSISLEKLAYNASMEKDMYLNLPSEIVAVVGKELRIYHRSVIAAINPYNYSIEVVCSIGKNYPRYFSVVPITNNIGTHTLTYYVRNNQDATIISKSITLKVVASLTAGNTYNANILCVGASVVNNGWMQAELKRMLTTNTQNTAETSAIKQIGTFYPQGLNLSGVNFVGSKERTRTLQEKYLNNGAETTNTVASIVVNYEATGGYEWKNYAETENRLRFVLASPLSASLGDTFTIDGLTGVVFTLTEINGNEISGTYTGSISGIQESGTLRSTDDNTFTVSYTSESVEGDNPFSDISNYADSYCDGEIDIVIFQLGVNDALHNHVSEDTIKAVIDNFHTNFLNVKILLTSPMLPDPNGGMGVSYGASSAYYWNKAAHQFKVLYDALENVAKDANYSSFVSFVHIGIMCDIEHAYQYEDANVSVRSFEKEVIGNNGVHPSDMGCCELADGIFAKLNEILVDYESNE